MTTTSPEGIDPVAKLAGEYSDARVKNEPFDVEKRLNELPEDKRVEAKRLLQTSGLLHEAYPKNKE